MKYLLILIACILSMGACDAQTNATAKPKKTCAGTTKAGAKCKSTFVVKGSDYCTAHDPKAIKCASKNSKGEPCGMSVKNVGDRCRFHTN